MTTFTSGFMEQLSALLGDPNVRAIERIGGVEFFAHGKSILVADNDESRWGVSGPWRDLGDGKSERITTGGDLFDYLKERLKP